MVNVTNVRASTVADSAGKAITWTSGDGAWETHTASDAYAKSFRSPWDKSHHHHGGQRVHQGVRLEGLHRLLQVADGGLNEGLRGRHAEEHGVAVPRATPAAARPATFSGLAFGTHTVTLVAQATGTTRGYLAVDPISVS